jgi:inositol-phosphate phosphatase/L-galactose 1-phosphate phosphatase/histidinol-phosphatase
MQLEDIREAIRFAHRLADASGAMIREAAISYDVLIESKADDSPVTEIDRRVESTLREMIMRAFPEHGILGEEFDPKDTDAEYVWVIDPIDGTKAFMSGIPVFGTLISLAHRGTPIIGVIDHPVTHERWTGADGVPTTLNGRPVRTRASNGLAGALMTIGNPEALSEVEMEAFARLRQSVKWCVYGGSCYAYARLAAGSIDLSLDSGLDAFDYCALAPVIRNAGGKITDWEGRPLSINSTQRCIATGDPELHAEVIRLLSGKSLHSDPDRM